MFDAMRAANAGATSCDGGKTLASAFCPSGGSSDGAKRANGPPLVFILGMNPS
jgi:hypothetical protein